jgi:hypothetical protein
MKIEKEKQDKLEFLKQTKLETQKVHIGRTNPKRGHSLFEVNISLKTIELADFDKSEAVKYEDAMKGMISVNKKLTVKENCIYISALNKKNVMKILHRNHGILF